MNLYLPQHRALLIAETTSCTLHNIQALRGAPPRDALRWAGYLTEDLRLYAPRSDVVLMSHCFPRFGQEELTRFLTKQRDSYKYIHDQSVRLMNLGLTPTEIAERMRLPDSLAREWYDRGYYGTVSHNSKAVYDRYLGWFDGIPADLNPLPVVEAAKRYVDFAGGVDRMLAAGSEAARKGDYRWAADAAEAGLRGPDNARARATLADVYEQLGYQSESGLWRNVYLAGAKDLRDSKPVRALGGGSPDLVRAMPTAAFLEALATRIDPEKIGDAPLTIDLRLTDRPDTALMTISNWVLVPEMGRQDDQAQARLVLPWTTLLKLFSSNASLGDLEASDGLQVSGDPAAVERLRAALTHSAAILTSSHLDISCQPQPGRLCSARREARDIVALTGPGITGNGYSYPSQARHRGRLAVGRDRRRCAKIRRPHPRHDRQSQTRGQGGSEYGAASPVVRPDVVEHELRADPQSRRSGLRPPSLAGRHRPDHRGSVCPAGGHGGAGRKVVTSPIAWSPTGISSDRSGGWCSPAATNGIGCSCSASRTASSSKPGCPGLAATTPELIHPTNRMGG